MAEKSQHKEKIHVYVPVGVNIEELLEKVAKLRQSEGKQYKPYGRMEYTVSEVIIDALQELADQYEDRMKVVKNS